MSRGTLRSLLARRPVVSLAVKARLRRLEARRRFWQSYRTYSRLAPEGLKPEFRHVYPCLGEEGALRVDATYLFQDWWAFAHIVERRPPRHVDVGSHHKFVALLSAVVPTTMVDLRPLTVLPPTLDFRQGTIVELPFEADSVPSLSSLCVLEHVGLGRYGDPLDAAGSEHAAEELKRVLAPGGLLYVSVPIDGALAPSPGVRTHFNAHRVFSEDYFLSLLSPLEIVESRYIVGDTIAHERPPGDCTGCYLLKAARNRPAQAEHSAWSS